MRTRCLWLPAMFVLLLAPLANAQNVIVHPCRSWEDGDPKYEPGGAKDGVLVFAAGITHVVTNCEIFEDGLTLVIEEGAVVKMAGGYETDSDGNYINWRAGGYLRIYDGKTSTVLVDGATITDIRDDTAGGDTNGDGSATAPSVRDSYLIHLVGSGTYDVRNSTIKYCQRIEIVGNSPVVTGNTFLQFGGIQSLVDQRRFPDLAAPIITHNTFELAYPHGRIMDLTGTSPHFAFNTVRSTLAENSPGTQPGSDAPTTALRIGPRLDYNAQPRVWGPGGGTTLIEGNRFETHNGVEVHPGLPSDSSYQRVDYRAVIRDNTFDLTLNPSTRRKGGTALLLTMDADVKVTGNEVLNSQTAFWVVASNNQVAESRLHINGNRFSLAAAGDVFSTTASHGAFDAANRPVFVDAENNYWGDPSGPSDPYISDSLYNPRGKGLSVGPGIDYIPFVGGVAELQDDIHIEALAQADEQLEPNSTTTFNITVDRLRLRTAPRGRIEVSFRDPDGVVLENMPAMDVTGEQSSVTLPPFPGQIPDDIGYLTVEAELIPSGETRGVFSNVERFPIRRPASSFSLVGVVDPTTGKFPVLMQGTTVKVRAAFVYSFSPVSAGANGTFEFYIEERIRGTKDGVGFFPIVTAVARPGKNQRLEQDFQIPLIVRNHNDKTDLFARMTLLDDRGEVLEKQRVTLPVREAGEIDIHISGVSPETLVDWGGYTAFSGTGRDYFRTGDQFAVRLLPTVRIFKPGVTDWQIWVCGLYAYDAQGNRLEGVFEDFYCDLFPGDFGTTPEGIASTGGNHRLVLSEHIPRSARKIRLEVQLVERTVRTTIVAADSIFVEVRDAAASATKEVEPTPSRVDFTPLDIVMDVSANKTKGTITIDEFREIFALKAGPFDPAAGKVSDYTGWQLVPLNRYWSVLSDIAQGDITSRISFTYDPASDFPTDSGFREDSLVVAGLNPLSGELEVLPSVLDKAARTVSADYSPFFETYVAASRSTVVVQTAGEAGPELPEEYALDPNYPNPFNPSTTFVFRMPIAGEATVKAFNLLGQEVATLAEGTFPAGMHRIEWTAGHLASGVYLVRMQAGRFTQLRKAVLLR